MTIDPMLRLWVPILTHYTRRADGSIHIDLPRMAAHIAHIRPQVRGFLISGSTGDGWDLNVGQFRELLEITIAPDGFDSTCQYVIGCLERDTEAVLELAAIVEEWVGARTLNGWFAGLTVCPPVGNGNNQTQIQAHFETLLANTGSAIAVYQLPQVTQCEIAAETLAGLAETERITMFKDTSGIDRVVNDGFADPRVYMVRGAEGDYFESVKPQGRYDGLLLSTANGFGTELRTILTLSERGESATGAGLSARLSDTVARIFKRAATIDGTNPFSDSNRAVDHIAAYGTAWRDTALPLLVNGKTLPRDFIEFTEQHLNTLNPVPDHGYLSG
ncbi:MAG: dihydrodipicolinate synthase family protein [Gammaproteobacteria bacterium]|nr:dihydrodipicolinate synthase family protein [Gammaproteobacteria bacterium]